jgi:hypothetical protein
VHESNCFLSDVVKLIINDNEQGEESKRKLVTSRHFMECEVCYYLHSDYFPIVLVFLCILQIKIGIKTNMEWNDIARGAAQH